MPTASFTWSISPPNLPKPLSEIYALPTFVIPTSLDDVRECFRILNDIEAHCLRNPNLLSSGDIHGCRAWAAVVARNIEIPQLPVAVDPAPERHERRTNHKKTPSRSSAFTAVSAPPPHNAKRPTRSPSEPALPSSLGPAPTTSLPPVPPVPAINLSPPRERHRDRGRDHRERVRERERDDDERSRERELERERESTVLLRSARVHAVVQEEVQPLREKLELLQAHVQTLKHKRSARSSRHSKHAWASQDEPDFHMARTKSRAP